MSRFHKNLADVVARKSSVYSFDDDAPRAKSGTMQRCYHSHPALKLPGSDLVIYGGSCISPSVTDADVYIGFDAGMRMTPRSYPWTSGHEFLWKIDDMTAPKDAASFKQLVLWVRERLEAGDKVHCGCIGGHGRTGTFFAALIADFGEPDAINYVREHYCARAVESREQVDFLAKHYGVTKAGGSKAGGHGHNSTAKIEPWSGGYQTPSPKPVTVTRFAPLPNSGSIWDRK